MPLAEVEIKVYQHIYWTRMPKHQGQERDRISISEVSLNPLKYGMVYVFVEISF